MRCGPEHILWVYSVLRDRSVAMLLCDDGTEDALTIGFLESILAGPANFVLMPNESIVAVCIPRNSVTYDVHIAALSGCRRRDRIEAMRQMRDWMFLNSPCRKLIAEVPEFNRSAKVAAQLMGFSREGINRKSFLKFENLWDQVSYGLTKGEWECLQRQ